MKRLIVLSLSSVIMLLVGCNQNSKKFSKSYEGIVTQLPDGRFSGKIHEITLYVNTTEITQPTTDQYANFRQPYYISNKDYTTKVRKGDIVIWRGVSITDTLDVVNITMIQHERGKKLLGKNVLRGNGGDPEMVIALIGKDMSDQDSIPYEEYKIQFTVYHGTVKKNGNFNIDPKLLPDY